MTTIMVTNKIRSDFNNYLTNNDDYVWNNKSVSRNDRNEGRDYGYDIWIDVEISGNRVQYFCQ